MEVNTTAGHHHPFFEKGDYYTVIKMLGSRNDLTAEEFTALGLAFLRTGQYAEAEEPLGIAMTHGDLEASVEYGNLLRITNKTPRAIKHLGDLLPSLTGELKYRNLRWYGVALFTQGDSQGLEFIEEARLGYLSLRDKRTAARLSHTLAALRLQRGEYREAHQLMEAALPELKNDPNPRPLLNGLHTLIDIQLELGLLEEAEQTITKGKKLAEKLNDSRALLHMKTRRSLLLQKMGDYGAFASKLKELREQAESIDDIDVYTFASNNLANHLSLMGQHAAALRVIAELTQRYRPRRLETSLVAAMMTLRRGDLSGAIGQLLSVREQAQTIGLYRDASRATLLTALAAYQMQELDLALKYLSEALSEIAGWSVFEVEVSLREELKELEELLAYARLQPEMQPFISAALERTTLLLGIADDDLFAEAQVLRLKVLGEHPTAYLNDSPLSFRLTYSLPILAYLAMHPMQTRLEITDALWGEEDPERASSSFRKSLTEIRRVLGANAIILSGAYREPKYSLSKKIRIWMDIFEIQQLLNDDNLAGALSKYGGSFLARLPETDWLLEQRNAINNGLTAVLRKALETELMNGADRKVVLLASYILEINPMDIEIEDIRLDSARRVCTPMEIAKFEAERLTRMN